MKVEFPEKWQEFLEENSLFYNNLSEADKAIFNKLGLNHGDSLDVIIFHNKKKMYEGVMPYVTMFSAVAAGKPANILDKISEGAANTYIKENTLLTQPFVKDGSKTVAQVLGSAESGLTVTAFKRVERGRGVEERAGNGFKAL